MLMTQHLADFATFKTSGDMDKLRSALTVLHETAQGDRNIIPAMFDAFDASATEGEVWGTFRGGSGYASDPFGMVHSPLEPTRGT
ncbi:hypothetical protein D0Z08_14600 [Nocardioides immobilis]|uniref:Uncharacterized protein n=1 Tax=Nocardioides immobilis TaxID=2049295 RepID=A0A417Y0P9_9ACTN|nr:hypothetical protein [Nocardioides immobilis]RHW26203.1 hypothetical protein D0Z08_14600 [Nocardioides immobilis]